MLGHKVRRLRRDANMTQSDLAERLGISPSYLNLIEHNQRALTVALLLKLGQIFDLDLHSFAEDEEGRLAAALREVFSDPLFAASDVKPADWREMSASTPALAQAVVQLYQAYREARDDVQALAERVADGEKLPTAGGGGFPVEEVTDAIHAQGNYFPAIEAAAEALWGAAGLQQGQILPGLAAWLDREMNLRVRVMPQEVLGRAIRRYDRHSRRIMVSEMLTQAGRTFQVAAQLALIRHRELLDELAEAAALSSPEAKRLFRITLANTFAGAVMMPYAPFLKAAQQLRYDIEILMSRFGASFEQVSHRLTMLNRPGAKGIPFFLMRVDKAGNVSKRYSAAGMNFARFGGACPRLAVHDAFRSPGTVLTQVARMPDGTTYFSLARTVTKAGGGYRNPPQQFAIALGCEVAHAGQLVYADGLDLGNLDAAVPIGLTCRLCERLDCSQRAFPPLNHRLNFDENVRGLSAYVLTPSQAD